MVFTGVNPEGQVTLRLSHEQAIYQRYFRSRGITDFFYCISVCYTRYRLSFTLTFPVDRVLRVYGTTMRGSY